jgi:hypothetical protein
MVNLLLNKSRNEVAGRFLPWHQEETNIFPFLYPDNIIPTASLDHSMAESKCHQREAGWKKKKKRTANAFKFPVHTAR